LIELLVVVAIIALLISILLPSLGKARAQARTTQCAARISQLGKALFLYADDFAELFPFHIIYGINPAWGGGSSFDPNEDWIASKDQMPKVFLTEQDTWVANGVDLPRSGCLFTYTRFAEIYACPEFIRRPGNDVSGIAIDAGTTGDQRAFNYTRGAWCRKPTAEFKDSTNWKLSWDGPIMTTSKVYASSLAPLLMDEAWYAHVGKGRTLSWEGTYAAADPVWDLTSLQGMYHGARIPGEIWNHSTTPRFRSGVGVKQGSALAYDGHAELYRDPCPYVDRNYARADFFQAILEGSTEQVRWLSTVCYSMLGEKLPF